MELSRRRKTLKKNREYDARYTFHYHLMRILRTPRPAHAVRYHPSPGRAFPLP